MNKLYKKIEFSKKMHDRIIAMCRSVNMFVLEKDPSVINSDYWGLCEYRNSEIVGLSGYVHHIENKHKQLQTSLDEVCEFDNDLLKLFDELGLHIFFGKISSGNWGIHKHSYPPNSIWNMCVLDHNTENCKVGFHRPTGDEYYKEASSTYYYDHLKDDIEVTTELVVDVTPGDIYTFNVWEWHSFFVPNNKKVDVYVFYFVGANTEEDINKILERLAND